MSFHCPARSYPVRRVKKNILPGLPWWLSGKNPPASVGETRDPWSRKIPHALEHLSTTTVEPVFGSPGTPATEPHPGVPAPQHEKTTASRSPRPPLESRLHSPQLAKAAHSHEDPAQLQINLFLKKNFLFPNKLAKISGHARSEIIYRGSLMSSIQKKMWSGRQDSVQGCRQSPER